MKFNLLKVKVWGSYCGFSRGGKLARGVCTPQVSALAPPVSGEKESPKKKLIFSKVLFN